MPSSPLISAHELHDLLEAGPGIRLLDVRYRLDKPDGRDDYRAGHLPGAVYVDMDTELATHGAPSEGRHPLPSRATLQDAARRWGLHAGDAVVVYDDFRSVSAARAWWLLRGAGVLELPQLAKIGSQRRHPCSRRRPVGVAGDWTPARDWRRFTRTRIDLVRRCGRGHLDR